MNAKLVPDDDIPDGDDIIAAEYVLGVLSQDERIRIQQRLETDTEFSRLVQEWQERLFPLAGSYPEVVPAATLKSRIDHTLFASAVVKDRSGGLISPLAMWRGLALASMAIAALAIARISYTIMSDDRHVQMIASMEADGSPVKTVALYDQTKSMLRLTLLSGEMPPDRSMELWLIPEGGDPVSLGMMQQGAVTEIAVAPAHAAMLHEGVMLAFSVEPMGGSPSGKPTGPVVAAGQIKEI